MQVFDRGEEWGSWSRLQPVFLCPRQEVGL